MRMTTSTQQLRRVARSAPMLDEETERSLLRAVRESDDSRAMSRLIESHLRLVLATAKRFHRDGVSMDDLVSEGTLGLVEAARRFDPDKGARFATYATWWVRALIRRYALANRRIVSAPSTRNGRKVMGKLRETERRLTALEGRRPTRARLAQELGVSPEEIAQVDTALSGRDVRLSSDREGCPVDLASGAASPEDEAATRELAAHTRASVAKSLERLDARERIIVERRLLSEEAETLACLGDSLGISRERVRQIEMAAKAKMRESMLDLVA